MKHFQPILKLTNLCNLDCSYCYYKDTLKNNDISKIMPDKVWQSVVDKALDYNLKNKYYGIDFCLHGGEPTLFPINKLKDFIKYVKNKSSQMPQLTYTFSIQSNGMHFSQELIDLCREENINVGISLDGPAYINEVNRKS